MERKLARFTAFFTCAFSLFICVAVWFLPVLEESIEAFRAGIRRDQLARQERYALLEKMTAMEIMEYNTRKVQEQAEAAAAAEKEAEKEPGKEGVKEKAKEKEEEVIVITHQMQIELPKGADDSNVEILPKYIDRRIEIGIPGADENFLYDYLMLGKSEDIESLESMDYFSENNNGTIVLNMDRVMEVKSSFDDDYLYLDFFSPKEIYDRVIVVDAGHGGRAPGAVSGDKYEKNITLAIVQQIKALFDKAGDKKTGVYYTRLDDSNPELSQRVGLANLSDADLFVSVHINSLKGHTSVEGVEVMYNELAPDTEFDTKDFAQICLDEEVKATGAKKRRIINGNQIYIIRNAIAPAALVEVGFMNNPSELARLSDASYQRRAAEGIYNALLKSLERLDELGIYTHER